MTPRARQGFALALLASTTFIAHARADAPVAAATSTTSDPRSRAATRSTDGAYGRFDGDLGLGFDAGIALSTRVAPAGDVHALYLATAGIYGSVAGRTSDASSWSFAGGVELRPLFLPRFLTAREHGPAELDLILDSLSMRIGARRTHEGAPPALELGAGLELPLTARFDGPYLALRALALLTQDRLRGQHDDASGPAYLVSFTIGWRAVALAHIVDFRDVPR